MVEDPYWPRASEWLASGSDRPALAVVGVPNSNASISGSDAWRAPTAIRAALRGFSTFHGERDVDLEALPVADLGDWDVRDLDPHPLIDAIDGRARALSPDPVHVFLGGAFRWLAGQEEPLELEGDYYQVHEAVLQLTDAASGVTGTLTTDSGRAADVSGSVSGSRLSMEMTFTDECGGSAASTLDITDGGDRLVGNYAITDCGGSYSGGMDLGRQ